MPNRANEYPEAVMCPLVDEMIAADDCIENQDVAAGMITDETMPDRFKEKENWREMCKGCEYYETW